MLLRLKLFVASSLILAGCSLAQTETQVSNPTQTTLPTLSPTTAIARAQPAPTTIPRRAAPKATLADLMGSNAGHIDKLLGMPDIVRREGQGELRMYRNAVCVLHVFLYPNAGTVQATHIEARTAKTQLDSAQTDRCLASFS